MTPPNKEGELMLVRVDTVKTKYSQIELCAALIGAWHELLGDIPSKASIGVIVAQHGIETGGGNFAWNNNLGNVKAVDIPGQTIEYMALNGVWEIINGVRVNLPASNPGSWFRSFHDLHAGAVFHLGLLKNKRYASAWPAIESGNLVGFATIIRAHGYYTAPLKDYIAGMTRFYNPYMKSTDYEHALASLNLDEAPPLQPWVTIDPEPAPMGELTVLPEPLHLDNSNQTTTKQGIGEAQQVLQAEVEKAGVGIASMLVSFFGMVSEWLKPKS